MELTCSATVNWITFSASQTVSGTTATPMNLTIMKE